MTGPKDHVEGGMHDDLDNEENENILISIFRLVQCLSVGNPMQTDIGTNQMY